MKKNLIKSIVAGIVCATTMIFATVSASAYDIGGTNNGYHDRSTSYSYENKLVNTHNYKSAQTVRKIYSGIGSAAGNVGDDTSSGSGDKSVDAILDKTYEVFKIKVADTGDTIEILYSEEYLNLTASEQDAARGEMLSEIGSMGLEQETLTVIQEQCRNNNDVAFTESQLIAMLFKDTKADLAAAMKWFAPMQGPVGIVLGVGVIILIVLLVTSTVFDLVYIGLPMARNLLNGKAEEQGKPKPFGVSYDAVKVVQDIEGDTGSANGGGKAGGGNVYFEYLKRRILTYVILAVCILYLISGQLAGLIGGLLDTVSGITG